MKEGLRLVRLVDRLWEEVSKGDPKAMGQAAGFGIIICHKVVVVRIAVVILNGDGFLYHFYDSSAKSWSSIQQYQSSQHIREALAGDNAAPKACIEQTKTQDCVQCAVHQGVSGLVYGR